MTDTNSDTSIKHFHFCPAAVCHYGNAVVLIFLAIYFFLIPLGIIIYALADPALKDGRIPKIAFRFHRSLSPKYEKWAYQRVLSGCSSQVDIGDIAGTEWPVFGSVFYLWATESLQQAWENDNTLSPAAPKIYAFGAINAAADLVADTNHAGWVKKLWGDNYLHTENVFFRMLLMSALTSHYNLTGQDKYLPLLRDQIESLSKELDKSKYGLLDDYPGECYPTDVVAAIAAIKRADDALGIDHSEFISRSIRGFQGRLVDSTGLPPYYANARTGHIGIARGCSSQWMVVWAPYIWPEKAKQWYNNFDKHFWQQRYSIVGFREFTAETSRGDWYFDVDSGPVIAGFGAAASAFGLGAARVNGRLDHAYPLAAELIATSMPLPDGTMLIPRFLSNTTDAPYLGEAGILFSLTRTPAEGFGITNSGKLPLFIYIVLFLYLAAFTLVVLAATHRLKRWRKYTSKEPLFLAKTQFLIWATLIFTGVALYMVNNFCVGLILILAAQLLPKFEKKISKQFLGETS